ncbi:MarR family winged helix-turn-helix transcriptional regulator [Brachybacterium squillarum]|uniref:MarR family winged helix-turn-helix transcriptional regulator n=1 Tax=Brachybacterium squillarum TaxID=661979 RepID=UPI000262988A|nr:MarR family transcriptional regulator [Brachybacterium squillarum]
MDVPREDPASTADTTPPLTRRVGYVLKQALGLMRARMDEDLRPHGLTVPQYACLELLHGPADESPLELTNAELARGAFVSAQSMNQVVKTLHDRGLVERPAESVSGRRQPVRLTAAGRAAVTAAQGEVRAIEKRMLAPLTAAEGEATVAALTAMVAALHERPD